MLFEVLIFSSCADYFAMLVNVCFQNQFFISGLSGDEIIQNRVLETLYRRIVLAYKEQTCFRVIVVIPLLPGFQVQFLVYFLNLIAHLFSVNFQ